MNFSDAMNLVRTGGKVSRDARSASSPNTLYLKTLDSVAELFLSGTPTLSFASYQPTVDDIAAMDWFPTTAV